MYTTEQMLKVIANSKSENSAYLAKQILNGESTIEETIKYCGSFMKEVLKGNYYDALDRADSYNLQALKSLED